MNKHFFFLFFGLLLGMMAYAAEQETVLQGVGYDMVEQGYIDQPIETSVGILATNDRQSEIYKLENGQLRTLVAARGCGRYVELNADKTLLGFKSIDDDGYQAPAVLNLLTEQVTRLDDYMFQCGQVSFGPNGEVAYMADEELVISDGVKKERYDVGFYTNIIRFSPDGKSLLFSNPNGQPTRLIRGTGKVETLSDVNDLYNPIFSPDGRRVVWSRADSRLYVMDALTRQMVELGHGFGPVWKNSDELYYSCSEYLNNDVFQFVGISVKQSAWDGSNERVLIPTSKDCPQQVGLCADGRLLVPYAYGERRLVVVEVEQPKKEDVLYRLPAAGVHFGFIPPSLKENNVTERPQLHKQTKTMGGTIEIMDIPYINQVYDTPDSYAGCHDYGPVACAPSTSCMLLAYLGFFEKHPVTSRYNACPWGKTNNYSWYVGQQYTSQSGYTFSLAAEGRGCMAKGGYGFMWNNGSPSSKMMTFYVKNDIPTSMCSQQWSSSYQTIKNQCDNDHPYSWCITSGKSSGHLILPFRCDAKCVKVSGVWTLKEGAVGSLVVQDPYGDANSSPWLGDGRYSTYDYQGYNNGYYTMVWAWGVTVTKRAAATSVLVATPTLLKFSSIAIGTTAKKTISVTGRNLTDSIRVASIEGFESDIFTLNPMALPKEGGDIVVTFAPIKSAQRSAVVTIVSPGADDVTISLEGRGKTDDEEIRVEADAPRKIFENGRIYVLRNGTKIDILGNQK